MIEIAFGESAAGALKLAKSMKQGDKINSTIAYIGANGKEQGEDEITCSWSGLTMGGSSTDVVALTLALDIGDISDIETEMNARKKLLDQMFENFPGASDAVWETNRLALARLQEAKKTLEPVRLWICSSDPAELSGLYFVCSLMSDSQTPLSVVCIPEEIEKDNCIINYRSTGEVAPKAIGAFAKDEEPISELKRRVYSDIWSRLVRENAPLRAVINGKLMSVPKDFYDFGLRANMPDGEFKLAMLVGKTLIQIPGIGDQWLLLRIKNMLESGELIMVSESTDDNPYSAVVKQDRKKV